MDIQNALAPIMSKLDTICQDGGIKTDISGIQTDISDLKASLNYASDTAESALKKTEEHDEKFKEMSCEITKIKNDFEKVEFENSQLKEHLIKTECQNRRINLIIEGITEEMHETDTD